MQMLIEFDIDGDIIDVPQRVIEDRELLHRRFLKWLYDKSIKHKYWVKVRSETGTFYAVQYRSDAFVEWLNKKVLKDCNEKATIVAECVAIDEYKDQYPSIWF